MSINPQNFYISVIDLFSIIIPGGIATIVLYHNFGDTIDSIFVIDKNVTNYLWAILLLYSYILGHVIFQIGSYLDRPIYDRWKGNRNADLIAEIKNIRGDVTTKIIKSNHDWAYFYLISIKSPILEEVNRKMADSKFFRSLFVISLGLIVLYPCKMIFSKDDKETWPILFVMSILLAIFSCWSYLKLRNKSSKTAYEFVIFHESIKDQLPKPSSN
ncbi:MAG: hypothetical protein IPL20_06610 [Saprospiraceae bacterium]|nr:hypothetical protein [Saprospiraceae bacterium]